MNRILSVAVILMAAWLMWIIRQPLPSLLPEFAPEKLAAAKDGDSAPATETDTLTPVAELEDFQAVVDRPLFDESRKPSIEPAGSAVAGSLPQEGKLQVTAVALASTGRYALIKTQDGKTYRVAQGQSVQNWKLTEVRPDGVTLRRADEVRSLPLLREVQPPAGAEANKLIDPLDQLGLPTEPDGSSEPTSPVEDLLETDAPVNDSAAAASATAPPTSVEPSMPSPPDGSAKQHQRPAAHGRPGKTSRLRSDR